MWRRWLFENRRERMRENERMRRKTNPIGSMTSLTHRSSMRPSPLPIWVFVDSLPKGIARGERWWIPSPDSSMRQVRERGEREERERKRRKSDLNQFLKLSDLEREQFGTIESYFFDPGRQLMLRDEEDGTPLLVAMSTPGSSYYDVLSHSLTLTLSLSHSLSLSLSLFSFRFSLTALLQFSVRLLIANQNSLWLSLSHFQLLSYITNTRLQWEWTFVWQNHRII